MTELAGRINKFFTKYPVKEYKRGDVIISPDKRLDSVFYLTEGFIKQYTVSSDGRIKSVNIFKPQSFFPVVFAIAEYENKYYFESINNVKAHQAPIQDTLKLVMKNNQVIADLLKRFLSGIDGIINIMQSLMYETSQKKLAAFIMMLAKRFGDKTGERVHIKIPLTHQDLASFTGMIRETVSFEMKKLQKKGIIADNKKRKTIEILKLSELQKILA